MAGIRVRAAAPQEVLALAEPLEPATTRAVADLERWRNPGHLEMHIAELDGRPVGAVVIAERCRGRRYATPVVLDPVAAPALASIVDRSAAWDLGGGSTHVEPLVPHLARARPPIQSAFWSTRVPLGLAELDPRCREAGPQDLPALVELYSGYEMDWIPTGPRLRAFLKATLEHRPVLVAEDDGRIVAALRCESRSRTHDIWAGLTVLPSHRRQGLAYALIHGGGLVSAAADRVLCGVLAMTNPIATDVTKIPTAPQWLDTVKLRWTVAHLQSPRRFPGHRRLRRAYERFEGRLERRAPVAPNLDDRARRAPS